MASICGLCLVGRSRSRRFTGALRWRTLGLTAATILVATIGVRPASGPRFYPDDPLWTDDDHSRDASAVVPVTDANSYDFAVNTFAKPGERRNVRALNLNTLEEVPDSSWFVNRIGHAPTSLTDLVRGPDRLASVSLDGWEVSAGKSSGAQPGFRMTDREGHIYQIEIDPTSNPEMASGAETIGTAFYHAFGYHVVDVYLAELDPERVVINKKASVWDPRLGRRRHLTRRDIDNVLSKAPRQANGKYRVLASRFADGKPLGNFRYYGTRPDDPNDIVPHEHRRELRGARVFGAWLNHDDSRGVNSLDMLVGKPGRRFIQHYMFDFGSMLGSGTVYAQRHRPGHEYALEWKPGWLTLATLGMYTRPWMHIDYPAVPTSIGRLEADAFQPERWKPEYPNPAFINMRLDDAFWAARIVSRFDETSVRAIVEKARFTDPRATDYLTETLMRRREKVLKAWLTPINPLVDFSLSNTGELTFANAAVQAGVATPASSYHLEWSRFDNVSRQATAIESQDVFEPRAQSPSELSAQASGPEFVEIRISARHAQFPAWARPMTVYFRRSETGWTLVGLTRLPD